VIEFGDSPTRLYGFNNYSSSDDFNRMEVGPGGVSLVNSVSSLFGGRDIKFSNGLLYSTGGTVINPETQTLLGRFNISYGVSIVPDPATGRMYVLSAAGGLPTLLQAFDLNTFVPLGSVQIDGVTTPPSSLVRWGANGLAFRDRDHVFLVQTSLVPSAEPVPAATPSPSPTPSPTPEILPTPDELKIVTLYTNDLVYDEKSQNIYASVPSSAGANGNSIAQINPATATVSNSVFMGGEPGRLTLSDNGQYLYAVLLDGTALGRFDLNTQTPGPQFNLGKHASYGQYYATDVAVMPGSPQTLAVARKFNNFFAPRHAGVAIFDDGIQRPVTTPATENDSDGIEFSSTGQVLYGYDGLNIPNNLRQMAVGPCGVSVYNVGPPLGYYFDSGFKFENGLLYSNLGRVVEPESGASTGTFTRQYGFPGSIVAPDYRTNRVFFLNPETMIIRAYELSTFRPLGSFQVPGAVGVPTSLRRWGSNGLVFRTSASQVVLIRTSLIPDSTQTPPPAPPPETPIFKLSGSITDINTHAPLVGATVTLSGTQTATTQTDAAGHYSFGNLDQCGS
jgi:hypothetical protein